MRKLTTNVFIERAKEIHKGKYEYSLVEYCGNRIKVKIICKIHGVFEQRPSNHLYGYICEKCAGNVKLSKDDFISKSISVHGNIYDYSIINYKNAHSKILIICKKHGSFEMKPNNHLNGQGCKSCSKVNYSKGEIKISNYLLENNIDFIPQKTFIDCKYKNTLSFDFYLPTLDICVEFDGIQHFKSIEHFGGDKMFEIQKVIDNIKNLYCINNSIKLIRIPYYELNNINNILFDKIKKR